jgi:O-antigen/teichoic acid export membrane protein
MILIVAARLLSSDGLSSLTMVQLLVVTAVGLQRATLLTPSFAAQRTSGMIFLPLRWMLYASVPGAVVAAALMPLLTPLGDFSYVSVAVLCLAVVLPALIQDMLRFAFFTRQRPGSALISDLTWLATASAGLALSALTFKPSWPQLLLVWAGAGVLASAVGFVLLWVKRNTGEATSYARVRDVWRFGKWSGGDAALSGAANLLPMVVSTLALGSPVAAVYRVLQTANGPFNILSATFLTSAGMDAWKLADAEEIRKLKRRTARQALVLALLAAAFYAVAFPVILLVAGVQGAESIRVAVILMFAGVLGAATIPITAAASAMGFQRVGFYIRVVVVVSAVAVSILAAAGAYVPWSDPVGVVAIISAVAGLVGWGFGYEAGYRREHV